MRSLNQILRTAGLVAAVLVLPCCRDEVGKGDQLKSVTVRASLNLSHMEPNSGCFEPAFSHNGRWLVFTSAANVITPNDNNGIRDVFLKDRQTGEIFNITDVVIFAGFPQYAPEDCFEPAVSDDGNFIVFSSTGGWVPYTGPASPNTYAFVYRYDRTNKVFERAYITNPGFTPPSAPLTRPTISANGKIVAFQSAATNLIPPNPGGTTQIYVFDFDNPGSCTVVSREQSPAALNTPCNDDCFSPKISADGTYVVFQSNSTNLNAATFSAVQPQVYRGTSGGAYVTVLGRSSSGTLANDATYLPDISADGQYVVFSTYDKSLVTPATLNDPILVRRNLATLETELVTEFPGQIVAAIFPNGYRPSINADGRYIAFLGRANSLAGTQLNGIANVFVRDMQGGITFASRHLDGTPSNRDCEVPHISGDGRWVAWATEGSTLVDGDSNGVSDVFLRGPLR